MSETEPKAPEIRVEPRTSRERLAYLEGWVAGAEYALEHPIEHTTSLANTLNLERLALWREFFE